MKLLVINGSYHKDGNTSSFINKAIEGFKSVNPDVEIETINLIDKNINFCTGCKNCGRNELEAPIGRCGQEDDAREIMEKMLNCDRIILASPIYYGGVTAIMKRLIERSIAFSIYLENAAPKLRNKINKNRKGIIILCSDCPAPLNRLMLYTFYPIRTLKILMEEAGIKCINTLAGSVYQKNFFEKRSYKIGANLAK